MTALAGAAVLAALAAWLVASGPGAPRRADPMGGSVRRAGPARRQPEPSIEHAPDAAARWARPAAVLAGVAMWLAVGGVTGAVAGALTVVAVPLCQAPEELTQQGGGNARQ